MFIFVCNDAPFLKRLLCLKDLDIVISVASSGLGSFLVVILNKKSMHEGTEEEVSQL